MKGIVLAGGSGTRLHPLTLVTSKQLLPVYDKPMIYYSLSILMEADIKDILIISTPLDTPRFKELFKDGSALGLNISYKVQEAPNGIAEAFILGKEFINNEECALILGDNIFYGDNLKDKLLEATKNAKKGYSTVFGYEVNDPKRFGVIEFDENNKAISIEEKPLNPKSNFAVTGLYFYPKNVTSLVNKIKPSNRNELEITDLNKLYLENNTLYVEKLDKSYVWMDAGTIDSLYNASKVIKDLEDDNKLIGCIELISLKNKWINKDEFNKLIMKSNKSSYCDFLIKHVEGEIK